MPLKIKEYLDVLFEPTEFVWVSDNLKGKYTSVFVPYVGKVLAGKANFIGLHSAKGPELARKTENESALYRNLLVEMDDPLIDPTEQQAMVDRLGLPYSTATYSGGKSVHFVISLATPVGWDEYKSLAAKLKQVIPKMDQGVDTHTRFTRLPFAFRDGVEQKLLNVNGRVQNTVLDGFLANLGCVDEPIAKVVKTPLPKRATHRPDLTVNDERAWVKSLMRWYVNQHLQGGAYNGQPLKLPCPACRNHGKDRSGDNLQVDGPEYYFHCFNGHSGSDVIAAVKCLKG